MTGKHYRDLELVKDDWFNFICIQLKLDKNKPISEEQLQALGYKYIEFKQIDKFEYQMKIEKN